MVGPSITKEYWGTAMESDAFTFIYFMILKFMGHSIYLGTSSNTVRNIVHIKLQRYHHLISSPKTCEWLKLVLQCSEMQCDTECFREFISLNIALYGHDNIKTNLISQQMLYLKMHEHSLIKTNNIWTLWKQFIKPLTMARVANITHTHKS